MKQRLTLFITLLIVLGVSGVTTKASPALLTLEAALGRVAHHSDYQSWQQSLESTDDTVQGIRDKHALKLDINGNILSYSYNVDKETSDFSSGAGLTLTKSTLGGTSLTGRVSPSWNLSNGSTSANWSIEVSQAIWPSPRLSSDQITLKAADKTASVLAQQRDYVVMNAQFKIERLYRSAQIAVARVGQAETSLDTAQKNLRILEQKRALGEASELDMINGELAVLRAERDLESARASLATAKRSLFEAIDLTGEYDLEPLDVTELHAAEVVVDLDGLLANVEHHPLVLTHEPELTKASLELEAGLEALKPQANLSVSLKETPQQGGQGGTVFQASITIGYPLLDGNQRAKTLENLSDNLEKTRDAYESALESVVRLIHEAEAELEKLSRDREIAGLTLRQAELEWEAAQLQYEVGMIDISALVSAEMRHKQAQLDYFESNYNYNWAQRRLSFGIVGDLTGTGGPAR